MLKWILSFTPAAKDDLEKLDKSSKKRVIEKLDWLQNHFNEIIPLALTGKWQGFFKLRVGDLRVIYKIEWDKNFIIVYIVDRRDKIYKKA